MLHRKRNFTIVRGLKFHYRKKVPTHSLKILPEKSYLPWLKNPSEQNKKTFEPKWSKNTRTGKAGRVRVVSDIRNIWLKMSSLLYLARRKASWYCSLSSRLASSRIVRDLNKVTVLSAIIQSDKLICRQMWHSWSMITDMDVLHDLPINSNSAPSLGPCCNSANFRNKLIRLKSITTW